jgi:glycosyltransferase involved in cell wall biosynthesis
MRLRLSRLTIFFHPRFSDGGVERTNIYLGKGLIENGYEVEFLTTTATSHFQGEITNIGIRMVELGPVRTLFTIKRVYRHLSEASRKYEKVYFVSCQYYVNVASMLMAMLLKRRLRNVRYITSDRNHLDEFSVHGGLKSRAILFLVRHLYRFADVIVANSEETAKDLGRFVKRKVHWVHNPTINERIDVLRQEPVSEDWFIGDARPCVIGIGRLSLQKDFSTLLRAFRLVRDRTAAKLVILGDGELHPHLLKEADSLGLAKDVYLPGFVANPYKFLAASQVFVLSSRYEGLPNALIEAVYLGIPCVSTTCKSGPREILMGGLGGHLVGVQNSSEMAAAIVRALTHRAESSAKSQVAARGLQRFSYEEGKRKFEEVINL